SIAACLTHRSQHDPENEPSILCRRFFVSDTQPDMVAVTLAPDAEPVLLVPRHPDARLRKICRVLYPRRPRRQTCSALPCPRIFSAMLSPSAKRPSATRLR